MGKGTAAENLREQVEAKRGPEDRTIITFEYCYDMEVKPKYRQYYTFVAIWIEGQGKWYSTGIGSGVPREATNEDLLKVLASVNVKSASVATEWTAFKP